MDGSDKLNSFSNSGNEESDSKSCENRFPEIPYSNLKPSPLKWVSGSSDDYISQTTKSSLLYDPFTDELPPRPRFLRYKPRREIFEEEDSGLKPEDDFEETDDEFEEFGDENEFWIVKKLMKFLLITVNLVLCSSYITSMNTHSSEFEVLEGFRFGFCPILNYTDSGSKFVQQEDMENTGFMEEMKYVNLVKVENIAAAEKPESEESKSIKMTEDEIDEAELNLVFDNLTVSENGYESPLETIEVEEDEAPKAVQGNAENAENFVEKAREINYLKELEKLKFELFELLHTESLLKVFIGLSTSSAILTCLVFSLQFKKEEEDDEKEPPIESPLAEATKIIPNCDESSPERTENADSFKPISSSIHSRAEVENFREFYHQEAPTVEFLGEFEVGEISSSAKKKTVSANNEESLSEFSTMNSPSHNSFIIEKKILKKEAAGGDGEVKPAATPVRRSTRIRSRLVSP